MTTNRSPLDPTAPSCAAARAHRSIVHVLSARARETPDALAFRFLPQKGSPQEITWAALERRVHALAVRLEALGLRETPVLLLHPAGLEFVEAFYACLAAGIVAVPAYPPRANRTLPRLASMAVDSGAAAALTTALQVDRARDTAASLEALAGLRWFATDESDGGDAAAPARPFAMNGPAEDVAYLQYTSGSTSEPKGVMVTHANLLANSDTIREGFGHDGNSRALSWLPHFHDMGLVDGIVQPVYSGFPATLMDPMTFLQEPTRWLEAITEYRITHSGGPNFSYDLCARRVTPDPARLDLASWDVAYNGAEPVRAETLARFAERFAKCGFRRRSFYPAYGLAEATLKVSGGSRGEGPSVLAVNREALAAGEVRTEQADTDVVGSGHTTGETTVRIVDAETATALGDERVGEIWVGGPSVAIGYWHRPDATEETFGARLADGSGPWLRTGDLGFTRAGEVFVTGRRKDLVIVRGRNVYPQDLERTAESVDDTLRSAGAAAFSVEQDDEERLVLVLEVERRAPADPAALFAAVRAAIVETHEVDPAAILLVKPFGVPKTSSGKVRRAACRLEYLEGTLPVLAEWRAPATTRERDEVIDPERDPRAWLEARVAAKLGVPVETVTLDQPLARFGLDSLRAMELTHEIETAFGVHLDAPDLLAATSLADVLDRVQRAETMAPPASARTTAEEQAECELAAGQQALCFLHDLDPEGAAYTIASALRLDGAPDETAFEAAWRDVVSRHASLRARIVRPGGHLRQRFDVPFERIHEGRIEGVGAGEIESVLADVAYRPFDLERGPLFRVTRVARDGDEYLVLAAHHVIADLWSLSIVLRDFRDAYDRATRGDRLPRADVPSPAEFVAWQRAYLESERAEAHFRAAAARLADPSAPLDLPTVRPRPASPTFAGALRTHPLDAATTRALRDLAQRHDVTLYTVLLAGFQALLSRLSGQPDVTVGAPAAGRTRSRWSDLVGYLVNSIVLRADLAADPAFTTLVRETGGRLAEALGGQDFPFPTLVKRLAPERDASRSPFFDVMFELRGVGDVVRGDLAADASARVDLGAGLRARVASLPRRHAQFDLSVTVTDDRDTLAIEYEYRTDLFDATRIDEIADAFSTLLAGAAGAPETPVSRLPLLSPAARTAALGDPPSSNVATESALLPRRFEAWAALEPDAPALWHGDTGWSYRALNERANAIARKLRECGVTTDSRVAVALPKSPELIASCVAAMKAGGAFVPVDPGLPIARQRFLAESCGARAVIGSEELARATSLPFVDPDAGRDCANVDAPLHPEALAYVIFTSGTTGEPKGAGVTHANVAAAWSAWDEAYGLDRLRVHLQVAAPGFDVFAGDLTRALGSGATLVLCDRDTLLDPVALFALCERRRPEFVDMLPAPARELAAEAVRNGRRLDSFRIFSVGADAWSTSDVARFREALSDSAWLLNSYGITETTVDNTYEIVRPEPDRSAPPIGRTLPHTSACVVDTRGEVVPAGVPGELWLGGPAVSRGYLGRPDLTAERFFPDPHGPPGSRVYRTGDRARRLSDGRLEFLGRADTQVKIRGQRVEPGELQALLESHPDLAEAVVLARDLGAGLRLVAWVVPRPGVAFEAGAITDWLAARVPEVLIPTAFVPLERLPRTANHKIDRRRLPDPAPEASPRAYDPPRTAAERTLAAIWGEVLRVGEVSRDANFFTLGGDSILVIQAVSRARDAGLAVSARAMFQHGSLAELARAIEDTAVAEAAPVAVGPAPLLPIQHWFFSRGFPHPDRWNLSLALVAQEPLDGAAAAAAVRDLVDRHDALRARFERDADGTWQQIFAPVGSVVPDCPSFQAEPDEAPEATIARAADRLAESLDLGSGRVIAFGVAGNAWITVAHHLVVDGVSLRLLAEDFERAYRARRRGDAPRLPVRTASTGQYARSLADAARAGRLPARTAQHDSVPPRDLAVPRPLPVEGTTTTLLCTMSEQATERLVRTATEAGASIESLLLAAVGRALTDHTGERRLRIEVEGHGRDLAPDVDVSRTVGWFTETRPVTWSWPGDVPDLMPSRAAQIVARALRDAPRGRDALRLLGQDPGPPPEIAFNFLGDVDSWTAGSDLFVRIVEPDSARRAPDAPRTHSLEIDALLLAGRLELRVSCSSAEFDSDERAALEIAFANALRWAASPVAPDSPSWLPLTPMQEGMLFHALESRDDDPYVSQLALEIEGPVDPDRFVRAWQQAVDAHDALRTEFVLEGDAPAQRVLATAELPVTIHTEAPPTLVECQAACRVRSFDVTRAPLARLDLYPIDGRRIRVVFTHHHLLLDGWSLPLLLETVFEAYESRTAPARPVTTAARDFAAWRAQRPRADVERFFRDALAGFTTPTPLPPLRRRDATGCRVLTAGAPPATQERAGDLGVSASTVLQGAWALVLSEMSGERDVVFGVTSSGRNAPVANIESAVGLYINTLPMRVRLDPQETVRTWLHRIQREAAELRQYEDAPLADVQRLAPIPAHAQLFDSLLVFENYPIDVAALARRSTFTIVDQTLHEETNYPLTLVAQGEESLSFRALVDRSRLDEDAARDLLARLARAIEEILSHPDARLRDVTTVDADERRMLVDVWNDTSRPIPEAQSIVARFDEIAERHGEDVAIVEGTESLSYESVRRRSLEIARALRARGMRAEDRVGLALPRSSAFPVAALAVLRAGGAYVPLDPASPAPRLGRMIEDAGVSIVIGHAPIANRPAVAPDELRREGHELPDPEFPRVRPASLAYVLFTSGSTGEPKGIETTHGGVLNLVLSDGHARRGPGRAVLHANVLSFDASTFDLWTPLLHGGRLVVAPAGLLAPSTLAELIREHGIDTAVFPTGLFHVMVEAEPDAIGAIDEVHVGGDLLSPAATRRFLAHSRGRLVHGYGPTETTTYSTVEILAPGDVVEEPVPIGRPIPNTVAYLLDDLLRPVPVGAPGDLWLGGAGLARGYSSRPDLTAERFRPDPFGPPGSRLYETGDRARRRPDGRLEFLGRRDGQVKIRGIRVEIGEVEAALASLPSVRAAAVVVAGEAGATEIVGYVVAPEIHDPAEIRRQLADRLPGAMIPARFVFLEEMPLTPVGKVDRRALPRPGRSDVAARVDEPATPTELRLAEIWRDVLEIGEVSAEQDFFEAGGHSLHAMRVIARVRSAFGVELPIRAVFERPTIRDLARRIDRTPRRELAAVERAAEPERRRVSDAQSRLWFLDRLEPDSAAYNIAASLRLTGPLDARALEAALGDVVARHETLRTCFVEEDGEPQQTIHEASEIRLPVESLESLPAPDREPEAATRAAALAREPFDLARGPVLRARLFRLGSRDHVLALSVHHIAADGWSIGVLGRELGAAYVARRAGRAPELPELRIQYADWAAWQRAWLDGGVRERQLDVWRDALDGLPVLTLPTDRPRPARPSYAGDSLPVHLPGDLARAATELAGREDTTASMVVLAAFAAVLSRWSGQDDFGIGSPVANRTTPESESLIGCFVNTLVIRARTHGSSLSYRDLLGRIRESSLLAYANQDVPFERVVEAVQPERDLSRTPLFQVMFAWQNAPVAPLDLGDVTLRAFEAPTNTSTFDLTVSLEPAESRILAADASLDADAITGAIEFSTELFDRDTIARLWRHTARVLEAAIHDPDVPVHTVPLLQPAERERTLREWSGLDRLRTASRSVLSRFREQVAVDPDRAAAVLEDRRITYGELDALSDTVATSLREAGLRSEARVGLCAKRSPELLVGILAAWKIGAAYVPLDPDHPRERIRDILADAGVNVVLRTPETASLVDGDDLRGLSLRDVPAAGASLPHHDPAPASLAYVIYTSGTTGRPKGVMISHEALASAYDAWERLYDLPHLGRHLQMASPAFDVCTGDVVRALGSGATLVFCERERMLDPAALFELVERERPEFAEFVPAVLRSLVPYARRTGRPLDSLRVVAVGSDAWTSAEIDSFREIFGPETRLANSYGVTEAAIDSTCWFVPAGGATGASPPIGEPLQHATAHVLDANLEPTPPGVLGELYLGGPGVARGYHGRPDGTAEKFVPDPFGAPGARMYRTGDRARRLADGSIVFAGRGDDQIKIRGQRVELAEIESAVQALPGVRTAVVVVHAGETSRLAAYVVPDEASAFDVTAARVRLRDTLPAAWIPSAFVSIDSVPLSPNGKVDRRRLPVPEWTAGEDREPPATPAETAVAEAFADVLGVANVGATDDFFALGGHSLLAVRVISRLRASLGQEIPLRTLFERSTVRALAESIGAGERTALPPVVRAPEDERRRLSSAQWRLWFLDRFEPASAAYNLPTTVRLSGRLDVDALRRALDALVERHESLRTRFVEGPDGPETRVDAAAPLPLPVVDLTSEPAREREAIRARLEHEEAGALFDLGRAPLLRARLFRLGPEEHSLLVTVHHICADGWSLAVLVRELGELYSAFVAGRPDPLPPLTVQYADWAAWQRTWLASGEADRQLTHWKSHLADVPALDLPADRPRPARPSGTGGSLEFTVPAALRRRLEDFAREEGATPHMVLLAGYSLALARWSGQSDFAVGTPVANRRTSEAEPLIGFFVNTLALRVDVDPREIDFRRLVRQVRETALAAHANQDVPFERVVEVVHPERRLGQSPLFQVFFALQNAPVDTVELPGLRLRFEEPSTGTALFDLSLFLSDSETRETAEGRRGSGDGDLEGLLVYATDRFDPRSVERFAESFLWLLDGALSAPDVPLATQDALPPSHRVLAERDWNADRSEREAPAILLEFAARVRERPSAPALRFRGRTLSYGELNDRSNRLAATFRARGVGAESRVALHLERSFDLIAAVLATWKAGAAYVPIDPEYPRARTRQVLAQAQPQLVITDRPDADLAADARQGTTLALADLASAPTPRERVDGRGPFPDSVAYVIYTSGSTGEPKGVALTHRALENLLAWQREDSGADRAPRTLQYTSISFDVSCQEIFATLTAGGELVLVPDADRRDPSRLLAILEDERIERLFLPFVALNQLAEAALAANRYPATLREVNTAGEQLRLTPAIMEWFRRCPTCRLVNQYGPAETHVATAHALSGAPSEWPELPPIGTPLPNVPVSVLDAAGRAVPLGAAGELVIGGEAPARGYLDRPELTAERFLPHASGGTGARAYRTGDLVRFRPDGALEFLGRADRQVKIRGYRVEPGEIESVLGRDPSIRAVAVDARTHAGASRLCAWIEPMPGTRADGEALRARVAAELPEFMVPSAFVAMDALPLTPSGKIDRRRLPEPDWAATVGHESARTPDEELASALLADALGIDRIGVADDFFALGGHSLLATRVLSRVRRELGVEVPLRALFEAPTPRGLAAAISAARGIPAPPPLDVAPAAERRRLSYAQQRMWFLQRLDPDSAAYNLPTAVRLEGVLDVDALTRALERIVARHEALRTRFVEGPNGPETVLDPPDSFRLAVESLEGTAPAAVEERLAEEASRPFSLERDSLFRARLFRVGPGEHVLSLVMHHGVADGWSLRILWNELAEGLAQAPAPAPLPVHYADWAAWQRAWLEGGELDRQLAYWRDALADAPEALELPTDHARPDVASARGATFPIALPASVRDGLAAIARSAGATLHMALLAAWAETLRRWSGQDDVVVGTPLANRRAVEAESLIGFFVNTLPVRVRATGDVRTFRDLLTLARDASLGAYAHQDVPFERLVEELRPERVTNRAPIFQTAFALQETSLSSRDVSGLRLTPFETENETAKYDVMLILGETEDGLEGGLEYATDLFRESTMATLATSFRALVSQVVAAPDRLLRDLSLVSDEAATSLLERGRAGAPLPNGGLVHEEFERRVDAAPDAPALLRPDAPDSPISAREVDERANRLAHHLAELGAGPERRVALCLERSPEAIVAMLAILKTGAAYVPFDPADPEERVAGLAAACGAELVVTETRFATAFAGRAFRVLAIDAEAARIAARPAGRLPRRTRPENLAYLIHTSGSTGGPKPVGVEHRSLTTYTEAVIRRLGIESGWRFALVSTLAADLGHTSLWGALAGGGSLLPVSPDDVLDAPRLADLFRTHRIDALKIVPSHLAALLAGPAPADVLPRRLLVLGGEATSGALLARIRAARPELVVANHYGPTETTVGAIAAHSAPDDVGRATIPLGVPLENARAYVLDEAGRLTPPGVAGELHLGGTGVARGYVGRPESTAERFLPDPFAHEPGARMYRTGDRARWLDDGRLEFLGRRDAQIKVRGFRVELGEIEAAIATHPDVTQVAVVVHDDSTTGRRLVAYVAPRAPRSVSIGGVARRELPGGLAVAELNRNETDYIHREVFELAAYTRHGLSIRDGDTIFDVGGNIGLFSVYASLVARPARIFVFEPNPHLHPILDANLAAYAPNATRFGYGLAEREREARFTFFPGFSLLSGLYADAATEKGVVQSFLRNQAREGVEGAAALAEDAERLLDERFTGQEIPVRLRALSDLIADSGVDRIHYLKVNVEKAELDVLRGLRPEDWGRIDQAVVEIDLAEHRDPILAMFEEHGFDVHVEQDPLLARTELGYVYAVRRGSGRVLNVGAPPSGTVPALRRPFLSPDELREHVASRLPAGMQPAAWVLLETLPVTANGKLDRRRLPEPAAENVAGVAPQGVLEIRVAAIWADVLGREAVGAHDNFFDLGGHSLLLARVHARLRSELDTDVSVVELFRYPTVATLARRLAQPADVSAPSSGTEPSGADRGRDRRDAARARASRRARAGGREGSE